MKKLIEKSFTTVWFELFFCSCAWGLVLAAFEFGPVTSW